MTAVATLPVLFQEGDHASRPAANAVGSGALYSCTTHSLIYQTDGATWTTWATLSAGLDLDATIAASAGQDIADALAGAAAPDAGNVFATMADVGGGAVDPVAAVFGAPSTAFEFDTSSLAGLTAIGSPTVENADTTIPGHLYYKDSTSGTAWMGRYLASPSTPFTCITHALGMPKANYMSAALLVGVANPATGAFVVLEYTFNSTQKIHAEKFTNRTTFGSSVTSTAYDHPLNPYLCMVVNSTSSIDYYASNDGYVWTRIATAQDPSLTVGSVGVAMKSENASGLTAAFEYLRIWNSALSIPSL